MRWDLLTTAIVLSVCASSCGKRSKASADDASVAAPIAPSKPRSVLLDPTFRKEALGPSVELPKVEKTTLVTPGAAPRVALRYAMLGETKHAFVVATTVKTRELSRGVWTDRVAVPEVRIGLELTHPKPSATERTRVFARGLAPEIAASTPDGARAAEQAIARYRALVEGKRATIESDARGLPPKVTIAGLAAGDDGAATARELETMLAQAMVPLPEEPIGVGAKWSVVMMVNRGDAVVKQTATYELESIDGTRLTIAEHIKQVGEHQMSVSADLPEGVTSELVALFWELRGTVTIDTSVITPVQGALSVELRAHGRLVHPSQTYDHFTESTGTVALSTK